MQSRRERVDTRIQIVNVRSVARQRRASQPHDALVRWAFTQREHAIGLLKAALPADVVSAVDWGTVRVVKDSFVDDALRSRYSDVIIEARLRAGGGPIFFYTLIEHQRDVEPLMVFRVLTYLVRLWDRLLRDKRVTRELPPILPVVIHHSERGWTAAVAFQDIVAGKGPARAALDRYIPHFEVRLFDLGDPPERTDRLVEESLTALGQVVIWCLSVAGDDGRMEREMGRMRDALDEVLRAPNGIEALRALLRYLAATHTRMRKEKVGELFQRTLSPAAKEVVVTFLEEIRREGKLEGKREGRLEGKREGKLEGKREAFLSLLTARFGALPEDAKRKVQAADDKALDEWTPRVLTARTLEGVMSPDARVAGPAAPQRKRARRA